MDAAEVCSVVEEMGGKGVAQLVGGDVEGDFGELEILLQEAIDGAGGEAFPQFRNEEWAIVELGGLTVFL